MNLTLANIARLRLPDGKADHIEFDDKVPGFGIRLREGGSQTWIYQFKFGPKQQRMVLGKVSAMKPEAARKLAERHHAAVKDGRNPATERAVRVAQSAHTLTELVGRYLEFKQKTLRPRSLVEVRRHLETYVKPLHRLPVISIDKGVIARLIEDIAKASGVVTANRMRTSLSAMFTWAMKRGFAERNPVAQTDVAGKEKSRNRVLENAEIKIVWNALAADDYGAIIKLLLLTGQRLNEVAALRWSEIDFERNRIVLPPDRTKNGRTHHVPMSDPVRTILEDQQAKRAEGQEFVFARNGHAFSGWTHARTEFDKRVLEATKRPLPHWTPHDLRRTAATRMAEDLGVQPHVIEAILNHVSGHKAGIAGVYNLATYAAEKAQALDRWADHVTALVEGRETNITSLRRA
jgi:integrase